MGIQRTERNKFKNNDQFTDDAMLGCVAPAGKGAFRCSLAGRPTTRGKWFPIDLDGCFDLMPLDKGDRTGTGWSVLAG